LSQVLGRGNLHGGLLVWVNCLAANLTPMEASFKHFLCFTFQSRVLRLQVASLIAVLNFGRGNRWDKSRIFALSIEDEGRFVRLRERSNQECTIHRLGEIAVHAGVQTCVVIVGGGVGSYRENARLGLTA
jgi:hypothetical protein